MRGLAGVDELEWGSVGILRRIRCALLFFPFLRPLPSLPIPSFPFLLLLSTPSISRGVVTTAIAVLTLAPPFRRSIGSLRLPLRFPRPFLRALRRRIRYLGN